MKPAPFDFFAPTSVEEACAILADLGNAAAVLAGGQTLMPLLNLRMSQPLAIVDINRIAELRGVRLSADTVRIGSTTRQRDALNDASLAAALPAFNRALSHVGHYQTRNRGTIGGSVALGEPAAEMPATAVALDAMIEARSVRGTRTIAARDFYLGPYMTALEPDEILTGISYPTWPERHLVLFREVAQRPGDFALVGFVGALAVEDGRIARVGIAWLGMGPTPIAARQAEQALLGCPVGQVNARAVAELAIADTSPFDDRHASAHYRRSVGLRIFEQGLRDTLEIRNLAA